MNLELDSAQRQLVEAVRKSDLATDPRASGWDVLDALGIGAALVLEPDLHALLGQLDWCLVLEELGARCRDHTLVRSVRTFLDVFLRGPDPAGAADAFQQWVRQHRAEPGPDTLLVRQPAPSAGSVWRIAAGVPALSALPEAVVDPVVAEEVADRELLAAAAYAVGVARRCLQAAQERATERVIANRRLLEYQGTSHRLAQCAIDVAVARAGLWRSASGEDEGAPAGYRAPATAAACVSAALDCAHMVVQVFGAAGTSRPEIVRLFRTAYALAALTSAPAQLWHSAGTRRMARSDW
jgi:Acyl-CoA dehydrogenase, C-terminal domain